MPTIPVAAQPSYKHDAVRNGTASALTGSGARSPLVLTLPSLGQALVNQDSTGDLDSN